MKLKRILQNLILTGLLVFTGIYSQPELEVQADSIIQTTWGYEYTLDSGDIIQVGDNTTTDFKANVKTIRSLNNDIWFSLGWQGGTFTPSIDNLTVSFQFNNDTYVSIYPVPPSERLPEGGIEYDITLTKKPAKPTVTLDIDWSGITWVKIYGLDVEYDIARCQADFEDYENFVITSTEITGELIGSGIPEVLKTRPEYEVNSYLGIANEATDKATDYGLITDPESEFYGEQLKYHRVSKTYLYIHRGQMTDALGQTDWIDDIWLDEQNKTITFELDSVWLRNATYPVSQVCGVDPAYTEEMLNSQTSMSDETWTETDLNTEFSLNLGTTNVVLEVMLENQQKGTENLIGVRDTSSSLSRYVNIHEAEPDGGGSGDTHCRMFVQTITNGSSQQAIDMYSKDVSDTWFYILGYWENVSFTEAFSNISQPTIGYTWETEEVSGGASLVHHIVAHNDYETAYYLGIREVGSGLSRYILLHEAEGGGSSCIDFMVKADSGQDIQIYSPVGACFIDAGYFSSELDFVELWQNIDTDHSGWYIKDLTPRLDKDGRVVDTMLLQWDLDDPWGMGARDGDDTTTNRYLTEHEAEDNGTTTGELTGFSMSAKSNSSGQIYLYNMGSSFEAVAYLTGYFLPAATGTPSITNTPSEYDYGTVVISANYTTGLTYFTANNTSDFAIDITISAIDFTGGNGWTLSDTASPGADTAGLKAGISGGSYNIIVKKTGPYNNLKTSLAANTTQQWGLQLFAPTSFSDGVEKETTVTLTASAS